MVILEFAVVVMIAFEIIAHIFPEIIPFIRRTLLRPWRRPVRAVGYRRIS